MGKPPKKLMLGETLRLDRCPHCGIAKPLLGKRSDFKTADCDGLHRRPWGIFVCSSCGGVVSAWALPDGQILEIFPTLAGVDEEIPPKARDYLKQATESLHAPAGAIMLAAASVDAMLKERDLLDGSLCSRIEKAVEEHLITEEMAAWAHEIRLDANDQRHADQRAELPGEADARRCIDFAQALAQFLFVLPARVSRGRSSAEKTVSDSST